MVKRGKWSDAELECLKDIYPKGGYWMFHSFYADRSRKAVNDKANVIGLHDERIDRRALTAGQVSFLKRTYFRAGCVEFCKRWPSFKPTVVKYRASLLGLRFSGRHYDDTKMKIGLANRGRLALERNPNWRGGTSFEPYPKIFNQRLREDIRDFYGRVCLVCKVPENGKKLIVHHIDSNKCNNEFVNLVSVCHQCHLKCLHYPEMMYEKVRYFQWQYFIKAGCLSRADTPITRRAKGPTFSSTVDFRADFHASPRADFHTSPRTDFHENQPSRRQRSGFSSLRELRMDETARS
jgi:hypothetical protein